MEDKSTAVAIAEQLLQTAVDAQASDLYLEPAGDIYRARMRVDGFFRDISIPDGVRIQELISRMKVLARMMVYKTREPQEGRISHRGVYMRVSVLPTVRGERVVIRLFGACGSSGDLETIMSGSAVFAPFAELIKRTSGVVFISGPSGSGKTTTLYAVVERIIKARGNHCSIVSVEDPVEKVMEGIQQTEVGPGCGVDFGDVLPYLLRQDPEVIVVGETRDPQTALMVMQAGLTGHLVLSTIHTESPEAVIPRLRQMGVPKYLDFALAGVLAQRLVRTICTHEKASSENCGLCGGSGFSGRRGIFELLLSKSGVPGIYGGIRMAGEAARLVSEGLTNSEEILRVLGEPVSGEVVNDWKNHDLQN